MPINYKDYPANWKTELRPQILARDRHRCQFCGVPDHTFYLDTGVFVILTIAHLDQDIRNNAPANLAALCQRCHNTLDGPFRARHRTTNRRKRLEALGQQRLPGLCEERRNE